MPHVTIALQDIAFKNREVELLRLLNKTIVIRSTIDKNGIITSVYRLYVSDVWKETTSDVNKIIKAFNEY